MYTLARGNLENIKKQGCVSSLTGPIERGDVETVRKHLECLPIEIASAYRKNGVQLVKLAEQKHPDQEYGEIKQLLVTE